MKLNQSWDWFVKRALWEKVGLWVLGMFGYYLLQQVIWIVLWCGLALLVLMHCFQSTVFAAPPIPYRSAMFEASASSRPTRQRRDDRTSPSLHQATPPLPPPSETTIWSTLSDPHVWTRASRDASSQFVKTALDSLMSFYTQEDHVVETPPPSYYYR